MPRTARRHKGEGSIYARRDASGVVIRYEASVELDATADGKRQRKVVVGKTQGDVQKKLRTLQRAKEDKTLTAGKGTLETFLIRWLALGVAPQRKPRVYESYAADIRNYIVPALGTAVFTKLTTPQIQAMVNGMADTHAYNTIRNVRAVLRRAINQAIKWGEHPGPNPATGVELPRARAPKQMTPLDQKQSQKLLSAVIGHRLEVLFRIMISLGLRRGEVCGLRWDDVNVAEATLTISGTLGRVKGTAKRSTLQWDTPKTRDSARTLGLPPVLLRLLQGLSNELESIRNDVPGFNPQNYIFCSEVGTAIEPGNVYRDFKAVLKRAGLPSVRLHDLRHSCATLLIAQGVHLSVIRDILGHAKIDTTANIYGHVLKEVQHDTINALDALFEDSTVLELPPRKPVHKSRQRVTADSLADTRKKTP